MCEEDSIEGNGIAGNEAKEDLNLYIGVKNDLSPFEVDLKALTRGLVVVGQSGCGKSFLLGRLIEEILRKTNTNKKTQLLIIDANSDFYQGMKLKSDDEYEKTIEKYNSGLLEKEFEAFRSKEDEDYKDLRSLDLETQSTIFGKTLREDFNLSWEWLNEDPFTYMDIVKGRIYSSQYEIAYAYVVDSIPTLKDFERTKRKLPKDAFIASISDRKGEKYPLANNIKLWAYLAGDHVMYLSGATENFKFTNFSSDKEKPYALPGKDAFYELTNDLANEECFGIWRDPNDSDGIPERLFSKSRINIIETETLERDRARLRVVAYILLYLKEKQRKDIENYRNCCLNNGQEGLAEAEKGLRHTFILIDEAHNFAPEDTNDPHKKMLGELIHEIAAEGRKYGLHLILATQRPNKLRRGLLGELDNAIIMKMNSRSDLEHLAKEMRILDVKLIEPCLHFQGQGNALAIGEMTKMAPYVQIFKSAPRRTVEGGVDIPVF